MHGTSPTQPDLGGEPYVTGGYNAVAVASLNLSPSRPSHTCCIFDVTPAASQQEVYYVVREIPFTGYDVLPAGPRNQCMRRQCSDDRWRVVMKDGRIVKVPSGAVR